MPDSPTNPQPTFVSRGGLKLLHALTHFQLNIQGITAADFGCSTGGFTDCILQNGASKVYALDTAYGILAWKLRNDKRVIVMERSNCLHAAPPSDVVSAGGVDLIVIDASWTPQRLVIPAALTWLKNTPDARIISLIKPHYEYKDQGNKLPHGGILDEKTAEQVAQQVAEKMTDLGMQTIGFAKSPILGGSTSNTAKQTGKGNAEWLWLGKRI
ncbi:MAG: SAM-dependent methyltransferase [Phycisphaerales bacterium]